MASEEGGRMAIRLPKLMQWFHPSPADPRGTYPEPRVKDLILFVTDRCNMRCDHCMFWQRIDNPGQEMTLEELQTLARTSWPLRTVAITGGEPFLRGDLAGIVEAFFRDNQTHHVQINTNGLLMDRMEDLVTRDLALHYQHYLTYQVSLDGLAETHDRVRRLPGSFTKILRNLERLVELMRGHPFFRVVVLTNINKNNYHEIEELARILWDETGVEHTYDLVRGASFSTWNIPHAIRQEEDPRECDLPPREELESILERIRRVNEREGSRFNQCVRQLEVQVGLYLGRPAPFYCLSAGRTAAVVYSDGSVAACEFTTPFARLADFDFDLPRLWTSPAAQTRRKQIQCCSCAHSCFVLTSLQEWEEQQARHPASTQAAS